MAYRIRLGLWIFGIRLCLLVSVGLEKRLKIYALSLASELCNPCLSYFRNSFTRGFGSNSAPSSLWTLLNRSRELAMQRTCLSKDESLVEISFSSTWDLPLSFVCSLDILNIH